MKFKKSIIPAIIMVIALAITGCSVAQGSSEVVSAATENPIESDSLITSVDYSVLDTSEMFTERDIDQTPDLSEAVSVELVSGENITIQEEGIYVLTGDAKNTTVIIEAEEESKVQLVLNGVSITNEDSPAIYVISADKVFITSNGINTLEVTGSYEDDGDTKLDAVIFSKEDLVLNGTGTLEINSIKGNGIASKDDLKITGGTYIINSQDDGIEASDSIRIYNGNITIDSSKDALHCENENDDSLGYIYIYNGTIDITAADDAIRGNSIVQIDGGTITITKSSEGIEATYIQINGGDIEIYASDDGLNATAKTSLDVVIEVNGGTINVTMGSGDTDAFDSNGAIYVNGGTIEISANSAFDADYLAQLNNGTVIVNGEQLSQITVQMAGGRH